LVDWDNREKVDTPAITTNTANNTKRVLLESHVVAR
jgi:hypothetical protein